MSMSISVSMDYMQTHRAMSINMSMNCFISKSVLDASWLRPRPVLSIIHKLLQLLSDSERPHSRLPPDPDNYSSFNSCSFSQDFISKFDI